MSRNDLVRLASGIVLIVLVLGSLYAGGILLLLLLLLAALLANYEAYDMARHEGLRPSLPVSSLLAAAFVLSAYFDYRLAVLAASLAALFSIFWLRVDHPDLRNSLPDWALTFAGAFYTGGLLALGLPIRNRPDGLALALLAVIGTWACDTFAYIIGRQFGRHKLAPVISPNKTWEGAVGGYVPGAVAVALIGYFANLPLVATVALALLVPLAAILGDLVESMFKRSAAVKDSSQIIPGHGGILDRIDGLLFALLTVYLYAMWAM